MVRNNNTNSNDNTSKSARAPAPVTTSHIPAASALARRISARVVAEDISPPFLKDTTLKDGGYT